ncbi:alpha/beta hydrolase [Streptomyces sp. NBC_01381]|uniref:alpha/beta fold hydrolase n=1 Tax=Streptomyces sp. NBC_01381 TaxID=2903845 RepID=UPI00225737F4|nr:alpha/beta hydrolase [Streptomyces sp. NBC_01381]MCX4669080.1 alpha/beta hydrolase [Streptomyces sp. NBC_01381]
MTWQLAEKFEEFETFEKFETSDGYVRWASFGEGDPVVLLHGSPFSSYIWREIAPALARTRKVYVWDLLGFGRSEQRDGQDVGLAAQGRHFARLLAHWGLERPSVVAHDVGGAVALRALLLEGAAYRDLTLVDAVGGGAWGTGYFKLIRDNAHVFERLPGYAHEALVASHLRHATHTGYGPGVLDAYLAPWRGARGQAAFYRQYRQFAQSQTDEIEPLLGEVSVPTRIIWGREDRLLPGEFAAFLRARIPHAELIWLDGAGHTVQEDAPARLLAHLEEDFGRAVG